jgi:dUTP pyrophosphatase
MNIKIINNSNYDMPSYATPDSAGIDLKANIEWPLILSPLERVMVPTGLIIEIPQGHLGMVCPRSGLAVKQGLTVLNAPGIVDADFRQQVQVILINLSNDAVQIEPGDRIAQMVFTTYSKAKFESVSSESDLTSTERKGGFGSTGVK